MLLPRAAEADVGEADGTPSEDGREAAERLHPEKGFRFLVRRGKKGEKAQRRREKNGHQRPPLLVNVGENAGRLALLGQGGESARGSIDGGVPDRYHSYHDDDIHD